MTDKVVKFDEPQFFPGIRYYTVVYIGLGLRGHSIYFLMPLRVLGLGSSLLNSTRFVSQRRCENDIVVFVLFLYHYGETVIEVGIGSTQAPNAP